MSWAPEYATVEELRAFVRVEDGQDDAQMALALTAASRAVDHATGRQFGKVDAPQERFYPATWDRVRLTHVVTVDDLMVSPTAVQVGGSATTAYRLLDRNAAAAGRPWTRLQLTAGAPSPGGDDVAVTATWGWSAVPHTVVQATLQQASRFLARRDSPYGVAGSPDMGNELRLLARVDPDVETMLRPYLRWWGAM